VARDNLLAVPNLTTPQSKSPPPFSCHRTWDMGHERRGKWLQYYASIYNAADAGKTKSQDVDYNS